MTALQTSSTEGQPCPTAKRTPPGLGPTPQRHEAPARESSRTFTTLCLSRSYIYPPIEATENSHQKSNKKLVRFFQFFHGSTSLSCSIASSSHGLGERRRPRRGGNPAAAAGDGGGGPGVLVVQHCLLDGDGDLFSGGVGGGVPPASKAAIAALKEVKTGEAEGGVPLGDCAICLDGVEDAGKEMPCGHRFHRECLERWLGVHGNCPTCRHELPPAKEEDNAAAEGGEELRRPRSAVLVSYMVLGGQRQEPEPEPEPEREEPWTIRIEDVD